jgi:hypothetical protein
MCAVAVVTSCVSPVLTHEQVDYYMMGGEIVTSAFTAREKSTEGPTERCRDDSEVRYPTRRRPSICLRQATVRFQLVKMRLTG